MRVFYHYLDAAGRRRLSWQQSESVAACCAMLADCGIYPLHVVGIEWPAIFKRRSMTVRQQALFFQQLSVALGSGVSLLEALHYMGREQSGERQRAFVKRLEEGVLAGQALSEALAQTKSVPPLLTQWIALGERQGELAQVLAEVHAHLERETRMKRQIQQQLLYPFIVLVAVLLVGAVLSLVVMPMLARQFMTFEEEVPLVMRLFLLAHDVIVSYGGVLIFALVAALGGLFLLRSRGMRRVPGCGLRRRLVLVVPLLNEYFLLKVYVPFARLFGQLLQSGVPVGEALEELRRYFARSLFAEDIAAVHETMAQGGQLSQALAQSAFVPPLARQMLLNGERYGKLPQALAASADYYETLVMGKLSLWLRFIEPVAIVLLGLLVLYMALGLFVPMLTSYQSLLAQ